MFSQIEREQFFDFIELRFDKRSVGFSTLYLPKGVESVKYDGFFLKNLYCELG